MDDAFDFQQIKIDPTQAAIARPHSDHSQGRSRHDLKREDAQPSREEAADMTAAGHFQQLTEVTENAHQLLLKEHLPYRICVYKRSEEVFIDFVTLDSRGGIQQITEKNITHDNFIECIEHVESLKGLLLDKRD